MSSSDSDQSSCALAESRLLTVVTSTSGTAVRRSASPEPSTSGTAVRRSASPELAISGSSKRRKHYYAEEFRDQWNLDKLSKLLNTREKCQKFAEEQGLILKTKLCPQHRSPMTITDKGDVGVFRCSKKNCRYSNMCRSANTWFENVRIPLPIVFRLMYCFAADFTYKQTLRECAIMDRDCTVAQNTVLDWFSYCSEAVSVYEIEHAEHKPKIGGPGKIVQIDESKFVKRKYNKGRRVEGHWVLGMIEDGSDDLRLEVCPENCRKAGVLIPLIKRHVEEGTTIHTDSWRAYLCLPNHGYTHKIVNHSDPDNPFVSEDGTHTQRIESMEEPEEEIL